MHEPDGVGEAFEELLRSGLAAAGALARASAHARAQQLRAAADASEHAAQQARAALEVERAAARARLAPVTQTEWWDRATPQEIAHTWQTALEWRESDVDAAKASVRIRAELEDRYGIDPHDYTAAPASEPAAATSAAAAAAAEVLREARDGRRLSAISHEGSVADLLVRGGPRSPPRARRGRGRGQQRVERERDR
jgi:hypothetical protein